MTDLPEQMPDARAVLAAAYEWVRNADDGLRSFLDACEQAGFAAQFAISMRGEQAQALAAIGAGLATVEAADTIARAVAVGEAPAANRAADERQVPTDDRTEAAAVWASRIIDRWQGLNYSARGAVQRNAPTLGNALNDAADLLGANGSAGRQRAAEQAQPLPPVDNVAGCDVTNLGRRCLLDAGHDEGTDPKDHAFAPLVPAGPDRFA